MAPNRTSTKVTLAHVRKSNSVSLENSIGGKNCSFAKRKAEHSPARNGISKKPAFNDVENDKSKLGSFKTLKNISENKLRAPVTRAKSVRLSTTRAPLSSIHPNATSDVKLSNSRNSFAKPTKTVSNAGKVREVNKPVTRSSSNLSASVLQPPTTRKALPVKAENSTDVAKIPKQVKSKIEPEPSIVIPKVNVTTNGAEKSEDQENVQPIQNENRPVTRLSARLSLRKSLSAEKSAESSSLYISALEDITNTSARVADKFTLSEFDKELLHDPHQVSLYAMEIFDYLKSREAKFALDDYMVRQRSINENMRAVLVDWMVEVQESFELNHETLYLAVKIVDAYLSKVEIKKEKLQLVGAAALFLSCKYDERLSPLLEDFVYICDNAYTQDHLLAMEQSVLYHIDFELSFPISYSFLRRYARCARIQMPLLTLARFILELALMDYRTVTLSDSKQAAAALYLAFKMVKHDDWTDKHVYYTGYKKSDFKDVVLLFNEILHQKPSEQLKTIRTKYSHELFFKVARTPLISNKDLNLD